MSTARLRLVVPEAPAVEPTGPYCRWPAALGLFGRVADARNRCTDKVTRAELVGALQHVAELLADTEPVSGRLPERHVLTLHCRLAPLIRRLNLYAK
jgi:hypothetical protein